MSTLPCITVTKFQSVKNSAMSESKNSTWTKQKLGKNSATFFEQDDIFSFLGLVNLPIESFNEVQESNSLTRGKLGKYSRVRVWSMSIYVSNLL